MKLLGEYFLKHDVIQYFKFDKHWGMYLVSVKILDPTFRLKALKIAL